MRLTVWLLAAFIVLTWMALVVTLWIVGLPVRALGLLAERRSLHEASVARRGLGPGRP